MTFRILDASYLFDWATWDSRLAGLPISQRDLHFEPAYVAAYAAEMETHAFCAFYTSYELFTIQPFIVLKNRYIGHAYGYGGVICNGRLTLHIAEFAAHFRRWMDQNSFGERTRSHPFCGTTYGRQEKNIVYMDLSIDPEAELRKGHKSSLAVARRSNITIEPCDELDLFRDMYLTTMNRLEASEYWMFSDKLLPALKAAYPTGFQFLLAKVNDEPEAGCILLGAHQTCYYHYAGSYGRHRNIGVGQAVVIEAARWAKARGYTRLHLGGGTTADPKDPLFIFKSGFSRRRAWVYKYEREFSHA